MSILQNFCARAVRIEKESGAPFSRPRFYLSTKLRRGTPLSKILLLKLTTRLQPHTLNQAQIEAAYAHDADVTLLQVLMHLLQIH